MSSDFHNNLEKLHERLYKFNSHIYVVFPDASYREFIEDGEANLLSIFYPDNVILAFRNQVARNSFFKDEEDELELAKYLNFIGVGLHISNTFWWFH